jgi:hypothetical protein
MPGRLYPRPPRSYGFEPDLYPAAAHATSRDPDHNHLCVDGTEMTRLHRLAGVAAPVSVAFVLGGVAMVHTATPQPPDPAVSEDVTLLAAPASTTPATTTPPSTTPATVTPAVTGTVTGTIWRDQNSDGIRQAGEPGLPGITVHVTDSPKTGVTNAQGRYTISGLHVGGVILQVPATRPGLTLTEPHHGQDRSRDSDFDAAGLDHIEVVALPGTTTPADAGYAPVSRPSTTPTKPPATSSTPTSTSTRPSTTPPVSTTEPPPTTTTTPVLPSLPSAPPPPSTAGPISTGGAALPATFDGGGGGSATPTPSSTPTTGPVPARLAYTGFSLAGPLLAGLALLVAGLILVFVVYRRRRS